MTNHTGDATQRLVDALNDPDRLFERGQVAFIAAAAGRWGFDVGRSEAIPDEVAYRAGWLAGYEAAHAELTALAAQPYPPPPFLVVQGVKVRGDQAAARAEADADRTQRYAGGPVPVWGDDDAAGC